MRSFHLVTYLVVWLHRDLAIVDVACNGGFSQLVIGSDVDKRAVNSAGTSRRCYQKQPIECS